MKTIKFNFKVQVLNKREKSANKMILPCMIQWIEDTIEIPTMFRGVCLPIRSF